MTIQVPSPAKINLTLRVTGRRPDGYHSLCTLLMRLDAVEYLTITPALLDNVKVKFTRKKSDIQGQNILTKALEVLRADGDPIPPLDITIHKVIPPGTGLGCGSGNAAALINAVAGETHRTTQNATKVGADVPYLQSGHPVAIATGIGEQLHPQRADLGHISVQVVIPTWKKTTADMYRRLDAIHGAAWPTTPEGARAESLTTLARLAHGQPCGHLPNDFAPVLESLHPEYRELYDIAERAGALAWGITGSGSAAVVLWGPGTRPASVNLPWIEDTQTYQNTQSGR